MAGELYQWMKEERRKISLQKSLNHRAHRGHGEKLLTSVGFVFSVVNGVGSLQIKSPENLLVSGLGFLSGPSQAVAGSQVSHVAAAVA